MKIMNDTCVLRDGHNPLHDYIIDPDPFPICFRKNRR